MVAPPKQPRKGGSPTFQNREEQEGNSIFKDVLDAFSAFGNAITGSNNNNKINTQTPSITQQAIQNLFDPVNSLASGEQERPQLALRTLSPRGSGSRPEADEGRIIINQLRSQLPRLLADAQQQVSNTGTSAAPSTNEVQGSNAVQENVSQTSSSVTTSPLQANIENLFADDVFKDALATKIVESLNLGDETS